MLISYTTMLLTCVIIGIKMHFLSINSAFCRRMKLGEIFRTGMLLLLVLPVQDGMSGQRGGRVLFCVKNHIVCWNHLELRSKHLMTPYKLVS